MDIASLGVYACLFLALYFEVFLLISFFEKRPSARTTTLPKRFPTAAIVVPCFNEEKTIGGTLQSLLAMEYPADKLSVIVVDDGSRDNTAKIAQEYAAVHPQIQYFHKQNGGKWTALNFGIEHTDAELVGCLDADSFVAPDALMEVVKTFDADPSVMAITPVMKVYRPKKMLEMMQSVEYTFGIFYKKMFDNLSAISVLPGPFSLYRRAVFQKIGMFRHAHNTEDMEIAFRLHSYGLKIVNAHTAYVYTTVPKTVRALVKQRTRWSQGFLQNSRDYSYMYFNRKYGNFGMLILPVSLVALFAGLYAAGYTLFKLTDFVLAKVFTLSITGVPLTVPSFTVQWFYLDTSMMLFVIVAVLILTLTAVVLGSRISQTRLPLRSLFYYFLLFGFLAPVWLARAVWGAALARESVWR